MQPIFYFLPAIIFLGIVTSYEDIKENKIRNKWIVIALTYAIVVNLCLLLFDKINLTYLFFLSINALICLIIGAVLWYVNFWTAGDAKLFFAYSLLVPLNFYTIGFVQYAPSIIILLNLFIVSTAYMIFFLIYKTRKNHLIIVKKELAGEWKEIIYSILIVFGTAWLVLAAASSIGISDYIVIILFNILVFIAISKIFEKWMPYAAALLVLIRIIFDRNIFSMQNFVYFLLIIGIWIIFFKIIFNMLNHLTIIKIKKEQLRVGMVLVKDVKKLKNSKKNTMKIKIKGITEKDIKKMKKIKNLKSVFIKQTIPFAPLLIIGVIITILSRGNILIYLRALF